MVPPLKNEDLITKIWLLSKNKSVRAVDDRPYTDTDAISLSLLFLLARSATHAEGVTLF